MRVSREKAAENRETVINVSSRLFREHGFDGIGVKDLMQGAGMTQGAFYKQFESKDDLVAQASRRAMESAMQRWTTAAESDPNDPLGAVLTFYLSPEHLREKMEGCPVVALGSDAARQGSEVKASFEAGILDYLGALSEWMEGANADEPNENAMATISTMVGAMVLSRAVNDESLANQFLQAAAKHILDGISAGGQQR